MYVQHPNEKEKKDSKSNLFSEELSLDVPQIGHWRPLVATSPSRTPFINYDRGDSTALSSIDYPFGKYRFLILISNQFLTFSKNFALVEELKFKSKCQVFFDFIFEILN